MKNVRAGSRIVIVSPARIAEFWRKVLEQGPDECWLWTGATNGECGYGRFYVAGLSILAHRFAYQLSYGPITEEVIVRHSCDNPPCCNPKHLLAGTVLDNRRDAIERGRVPCGSKTQNAKLTEDDVREILAEAKKGGWGTRAKLAKRFKVSECRISKIVNGKTWRHITSS